MPRDILIAPIDEIDFADVVYLTQVHAEEGVRLELKERLSTSNGQPDRWMRDQSGIGRVARDEIAREIVAFANAYGGTVVIGVAESDDNPKCAAEVAKPQLPRVVGCAEQLGRALRSIIDPPLPMLEVRGIASGASGEGVIVARVNSSPSSPHGFGIPPSAYVRHGSESKPLSMRELQSMFFERRTRFERVEARRKQLSESGLELWGRWTSGNLRKITGDGPFAPNTPAIQFRCSLVPSDDLAIDNFPDQFSLMDRSPKPEIPGGTHLVELPVWAQQWLRRYRSVQHVGNAEDRAYWHASLEADGVVNQVTILAKWREGRFVVNPVWHAEVVLQGMVLAEWLRRWASRPDLEFALDGEFWNTGDALVVSDPDLQEYVGVPWAYTDIGPYSVGRRATFSETFDLIEREMWDAFGLSRRSKLNVDLTQVFRSIGL
jgi:hypothetical protein